MHRKVARKIPVLCRYTQNRTFRKDPVGPLNEAVTQHRTVHIVHRLPLHTASTQEVVKSETQSKADVQLQTIIAHPIGLCSIAVVAVLGRPVQDEHIKVSRVHAHRARNADAPWNGIQEDQRRGYF